MHVRNADGKYGEVKSVTAEKSTQWMYNLTVDEAHTFYVGDGQWLVHNMCPVGEGDSGLVRVGRWMSKSEYEDLLATSRVQPGAGNVTSVSYPASPASYGSQANPGSVYVEFDVPVNSLIQGGRADWFTILGPDSTLAKALLRAGRITELPQFPSIYNIVLLAIK